MSSLSHLDEAGRAHMVDVSAKADTLREATARGRIVMRPETLALSSGARWRRATSLPSPRWVG